MLSRSATALGACALLALAAHSPLALGRGTGATHATHPMHAERRPDADVRDVRALRRVLVEPAPVVDVASVNPGTTPERGLCVTVSAGSGAAYECGDLRLAHAAPSVTIGNRTRAPALIYNSQQAQPFPLVAARVTLPAGASVPTTVEARLQVNGVERAVRQWSGAEWGGGARTRRITLGYAAQADPTGVYPYVLQVTHWYGATPVSTTVSGKLVVVNRSGSYFGTGWWVAGLEQLYFPADTTTRLWVAGDGSARVYQKVAAGRWVAETLDRPDTMVFQDSVYARLLPGGARVYFRQDGRHTRTVDRRRYTTVFFWQAGGSSFGPYLGSIQLPYSRFGTRITHSFAYPGAPLPRMTQVSGEANGVSVGYAQADRRITSLTDPDGSVVSFAYGDAANPNRITARTDRLGTVTTFTYDAAGKLTGASTAAGVAGTIATAFEPAESRGWSASVDTAAGYFLLDGPRSDVVDRTRIWVNRFGAPDRVENALGQATTIVRGDARFPALATESRAPNGLVTRAAYNTRGAVATSTVLDPLGDGRSAVTQYEYGDARWPDFATRVTLPHGEVVETGYDSLGNRAWQQDGRGASSRVEFRYYTQWPGDGQVRAVQGPIGPADSLMYDRYANLHATRTGLGFWTLTYRDALGRDTLTLTPSDSLAQARDSVALKGAGVRQRTVYDALGRPLLSQTRGPAVRYDRRYTGVPENVDTMTLSVRNRYDRGLLVATSRWAGPDSAHVDTVTTRWRYDPAGRRVAELAPTSPDSAERKDSTVYDPAGNVVRTVDRLGQQVVAAYDALGRVLQRTIPATPDAPGEVEQFAYDEMGNLRLAANSAATVRRGYLPGGALAADTLQVATEAGTWGRHQYVTRYGYDLEGRRTTMTVPDSVAPSPTQKQFVYSYDPATGALRGVTDPLGNAYAFAQRLDGALDTLRLPGGIAETYHYDADGRMTRRLRTRTFSGSAYSLYDDSLIYTPRGKVAYAALLDGSSRMDYDGLGHLAHSYAHDALAYTSQDSEEEYRSDALGNTLWRRSAGFTIQSSPPTAPVYPVSEYYQRWTGRHYASVKAAGQTVPGAFRPREDAVRRFDAAGNLVQTEESNSVRLVFGSFPDGSPRRTLYAVPNQEIEPTSASSLGVSGYTDGYGDALTTHGYRGDGRLVRVVRTSSCLYLEATLECSRQVPDYHTQTRTETYRYDALGRRVWVKTVTPASAAAITNGRCAFRCDNTTRRTIWDGDQVLAEIRYPNGQGEQDTGLDSANVAARDARTERGVTAAGHPYGGLNTSDWAQHGRVLYVHAGGIDQPLGVVRMDYSYDFAAPTLVVPHASWRGVYESGTMVADTVCKNVWLPTSEMVYQDSSGHRLQSPVVSGPDGEELDRQQQRCFEVDFPGKAVGMRRLLRQNSVAGSVNWTGSLTQDNQDASGLMYRRNRFYDPKSGRFTQEDPIGLAGGVNSYGFAEGDPVSYTDPYGLRPDSIKFSSRALERKVRAAANRSHTMRETLEDMELNPNVIVHFGEKNLLNPGEVDDPYLNARGKTVINVWFDFAEIPLLMSNPDIARNGGITEQDVIQHETYGHAQPLHEGWDCRDETGCARTRENFVRRESGRPPRRF